MGVGGSRIPSRLSAPWTIAWHVPFPDVKLVSFPYSQAGGCVVLVGSVDFGSARPVVGPLESASLWSPTTSDVGYSTPRHEDDRSDPARPAACTRAWAVSHLMAEADSIWERSFSSQVRCVSSYDAAVSMVTRTAWG